ncbi:MAG TPA: gamma-glutamyltransferase [Gaiellaceae bacterium]|nr:gamma-glutamyltransferase [Gaiellaceae bacterium]
MRGAVAAGHELTAEAGARALAEGGNAVDACVAAAFASWVAESPLTGPGAGGFMLVHRARDRSTRLLDFFVAAPGQGLRRRMEGEMDAVDIAFEGSDTTQRFLIGHASCAVPGTVAGLALAHRSYGRLPWAELVAPAVELARTGVVLTRSQALLHALLDSILRHTPEGRAVYGERARLVAGDRLALGELADTLETLASEGPDVIYRGDLAAAIADHVQEHGGAITRRDLESYRVVRRRPVEISYLGHVFASNPPPSSGGVLVAYGLGLLDGLGPPGEPGSAGALARIVEALREQSRARDSQFSRELYRGGLARRLLSPASLAAGGDRVRAGLSAPRELASPTGTTHISAMDANGNAASLSSSTGAGSGVVVPGTGIHMNNMLGEYDLRPGGRAPAPGTRLTSMMAPSIVSRDGVPRLVLGSAGSVRLRGAVMQVVANVAGHGLTVDEAIAAPRVHADGDHVHCEGGHEPAALDELERAGYDVVRWRRRNLFFGGVAAVEGREDGELAAAGDPRRGGAGLVV